jgi:hypothetical protein
VADTISAIVGNIISGSARDKNTLDWLEKLFGKDQTEIVFPVHITTGNDDQHQ